VLKSIEVCTNRSALSPNGVFPGTRSFGNGKVVKDMGGCYVDLEGGEYRISKTLDIPEYNANMQFGFGSIVAGPDFPQDDFLITVGGVSDGCKVPQASCNIDINFPELFLDGSARASAMQINHVMGVTVGPGGYFLNFTKYGIQINGGHEVMTDRIWMGETNFDFDHMKEGAPPNATAIEINGNDHYVLNTIIFSAKVGVAVHGAADYIEGTHVWFPLNHALAFKEQGAMAFWVTGGQNRFNGCYIDGGRAVFENGGLKNNIWMNGFACCANIGGVDWGIILKGDDIGPGLHFTHNIFQSGSMIHHESKQAINDACTFEGISEDKQCNGLHAAHAGDASKDACQQACCNTVGCGAWQWTALGQSDEGCWTGSSCKDGHAQPSVKWDGGSRHVDPLAVKVTDVRFEDNYFSGQGRGSRATLSKTVSNATSTTFDFCDRLIFPQIMFAKVNVIAEAGFPRAIARPTKDCTVVVETDVAVTGILTVDVDSSEIGGHFI
jgi:hypothetical protein